MKRSWSLAVLVLFAASALAAAGVRYRIELVDGSRVVAFDPVTRGSVVTFRPRPGAALTGIPEEMVVRIVPDRMIDRTSASPLRLEGEPTSGLQPGEILVLGPTGDGGASVPQSEAAAAAGANAGSSGVPGYGGNANPGLYGGGIDPNLVLNPNGTIVSADGLSRAASSTDLARAQAGQTPIGPNGFPVTTTGSPTVIGPNGTPTLAPGVPGSSTSPVPMIGPNGTPVSTPSAATPVIGPNGTPVLAPGAGQPVIGPNGTPVLAPSGQPGSAQPVIGPNGTPILAPSGQPGSAAPNTAPNGTPSAPAPGSGSSGSSPR